jgi:hypothetical protein
MAISRFKYSIIAVKSLVIAALLSACVAGSVGAEEIPISPEGPEFDAICEHTPVGQLTHAQLIACHALAFFNARADEAKLRQDASRDAIVLTPNH